MSFPRDRSTGSTGRDAANTTSTYVPSHATARSTVVLNDNGTPQQTTARVIAGVLPTASRAQVTPGHNSRQTAARVAFGPTTTPVDDDPFYSRSSSEFAEQVQKRDHEFCRANMP